MIGRAGADEIIINNSIKLGCHSIFRHIRVSTATANTSGVYTRTDLRYFQYFYEIIILRSFIHKMASSLNVYTTVVIASIVLLLAANIVNSGKYLVIYRSMLKIKF